MIRTIGKTVTWAKLSRSARAKALERPALASRPELAAKVAKILSAVRRDGDRALVAFTRKFDGVALRSLEVSALERKRARQMVEAPVKRALERAAANVEAFHRAQLPAAIE